MSTLYVLIALICSVFASDVAQSSQEACEIQDRNDRKTVLHFAGSAESDYYASLSIWYAKQSVESLQDQVSNCMDFVFVVIRPKKDQARTNVYDAVWTFPQQLNDKISENYQDEKEYSFKDACEKLRNMNISAGIHHMFDPSGTEQYRQLLIDLNIPFVGSLPNTMKISNDKKAFRDLMEENGVPVPYGISFTKAEYQKSVSEIINTAESKIREYPMIVKPCTEDNSIGITFAANVSDLEQGIHTAFKYDECIIIEKYIELGREIRVGIIENESGEPDIMLPCIEYGVNKQHPIRTESDKLTVVTDGKDGTDLKQVYAKSRLTTEVGCKISDELREKLRRYASKAHKVIGARDFSLYDLRIDPNDNPYFIEANLFCSFAPTSVIVSMAAKAGDDRLTHVELFKYMVNKACNRKSL